MQAACREAYGPPDGEPSLVSLRELLAVVSAHEWRKKGVPVPAVQGRIHPHYGVFSPVRGEYVDLVAQAPLPAALQSCPVAFDIGVGTGVLSAVLEEHKGYAALRQLVERTIAVSAAAPARIVEWRCAAGAAVTCTTLYWWVIAALPCAACLPAWLQEQVPAVCPLLADSNQIPLGANTDWWQHERRRRAQASVVHVVRDRRLRVPAGLPSARQPACPGRLLVFGVHLAVA